MNISHYKKIWDKILIIFFQHKHPYSHEGKTRVGSQERSGWVLRKPYAPAFGFKNTHLLPQRGKKCSVSGFALLSL